MEYICTISVAPGIRYEGLADEGLHVKEGDDVIVQCEKYLDGGTVVRCVAEGEEEGEQSRLPEMVKVLRIMTLQDKGKAHENDARAKAMFRTAVRKVREHNLDMKMLNCHLAFDKSVTLFLFVADGRVDFRDYVRDLSGALHCRIELRQIGVRDEAAMQGGIGPCGRVFCCASVLEKFETVNVKMAKIQRLSLNPASVSGGCGRLKCCLRYEVEGYKSLFKSLPRNGSTCETPKGRARVLDCNALTQMVRVRLEDDDGQILDFPVDEIGGSGWRPGRKKD